MEQAKHLPLPFFKITADYQIIETSGKASEQFLYSDSLLSVLDESNHNKVKNQVKPTIQEAELEVIMKTKKNPLAVFTLFVRWENDEGYILCQNKEEQVDRVAGQLQQLRKRLAETDFALLESKEELERAMEQINLLSAPFISLTATAALIPLFGALDENKLAAMESSILHRLYDSEYQLLLFDFTSIGDITKVGLEKMLQFFDIVRLLGQQVIVCGVKPEHARLIHQYTHLTDSITTFNLQEAIRSFVLDKSINP